MFRVVETAHGRQYHELTISNLDKITNFEQIENLKKLLAVTKVVEYAAVYYFAIPRKSRVLQFMEAHGMVDARDTSGKPHEFTLIFSDDSKSVFTCNDLRLAYEIFGDKLPSADKSVVEKRLCYDGRSLNRATDGRYRTITCEGERSYELASAMKDVTSFEDATDIEQLLKVTKFIELTESGVISFTFIDGSVSSTDYKDPEFIAGFFGSRLTDETLKSHPEIVKCISEKTEQLRKEHFAKLTNESQAAPAAPTGVVQSLGKFIRKNSGENTLPQHNVPAQRTRSTP